MVQFTCGKCGHKSEAPTTLLGQAVHCGGCGELVRVERPTKPKPILPSPIPVPIDVRPQYGGLLASSRILLAVAVFYYALGAVTVGIAIAKMVKSGVGEALLLIYAMALITGGASIYAFAAGCLALRDIARNSFARP